LVADIPHSLTTPSVTPLTGGVVVSSNWSWSFEFTEYLLIRL